MHKGFLGLAGTNMMSDTIAETAIDLLKVRQEAYEEALHVFQKFHKTARPIHTTDTRPALLEDDYATWLDNQRAAVAR